MRLAALQNAMVAAITTRNTVDDQLLNLIHCGVGIAAQQRLEAYRANVRGAHLNALDQAYPVTREVLGPRYWKSLLEAEIQTVCSNTPDLNQYGHFMPRLLRNVQRRRQELADYAYLYDLARLEWRAHRIGLAPDDPSIHWPELVALGSDTLARSRPVLSRSLTLFRSRFPVDVIWRARRARPAVPAAETNGIIVCCVHRTEGFDTQVTRLDEQSARLMFGIRAGMSLEKLERRANGVESDSLLQQVLDWIRCGWIVGFDLV